MDRAHRIGQERTVNVYRLVTEGTVEEQIMALQRRKCLLAQSVVTESNSQASDLTTKMSG
jgi:TATA-binding protein-associated factor